MRMAEVVALIEAANPVRAPYSKRDAVISPIAMRPIMTAQAFMSAGPRALQGLARLLIVQRFPIFVIVQWLAILVFIDEFVIGARNVIVPFCPVLMIVRVWRVGIG
jgi:hypothetical protein